MTSIIPAIIAKTPKELETSLKKVAGFAETIMLDIMDGAFVPTRSLDFKFKLPQESRYQAHLMVKNVFTHSNRLHEKVETLIIHVETLTSKFKVKALKELGFDVYLALNPYTPVSRILKEIHEIDGALIMTVKPGYYGAKFLPECLKKIHKIKEIKRDLIVEVDGGMTPKTVKLAKKAGGDLFASGSYIIKSEDPEGAFRELENAVKPAN